MARGTTPPPPNPHPKLTVHTQVSVGTKKQAAYRNVLINVGGETARVNFQATLNGTLGNVEVRFCGIVNAYVVWWVFVGLFCCMWVEYASTNFLPSKPAQTIKTHIPQTEGLTVSSEEQELDIHSFIHHLRKGGQSNMYQCNIVSGDSHCVFKGRMKLEVRAFFYLSCVGFVFVGGAVCVVRVCVWLRFFGDRGIAAVFLSTLIVSAPHRMFAHMAPCTYDT